MRRVGFGGDAVDAVATSAIRDAENADALPRSRPCAERAKHSRARREAEARYGYLAAVNSTTLSEGWVLDLGGGSLQLVHVQDRLTRELASWPLGSVRMTERFLPANGPAKRRQIDELRDHVATELAGAEWLAAGDGARGGASSVSAGPCGTSRPQPSARQGCRATAYRGWSSSVTRSTSS